MCITFISNAIGRRFRRLWTITAEDDADIHTAGPSNTKSLDYDCDDDDNITSSKLEDAINAVRRYCYPSLNSWIAVDGNGIDVELTEFSTIA